VLILDDPSVAPAYAFDGVVILRKREARLRGEPTKNLCISLAARQAFASTLTLNLSA